MANRDRQFLSRAEAVSTAYTKRIAALTERLCELLHTEQTAKGLLEI